MRDFGKLYQLLLPYRNKVFLSTLCHLLMALFTIISIPLIIPFFHFLFSTQPDQQTKPDNLLNIVDWLQYYFLQMINNWGPEKTLVWTCLFIVLTIFLKNLFRYLALYIMVPVRSSVVRDLRAKLYNSYILLSFKESKNQNRGDLITRMSSDVQEIEWNMLRFIDTIIKSPIIILGAVLLMLSISVKLSLFVVILMLFTVLVIGTLSKRLKRQSADLQDKLSSITHSIDESLDGSLLINIYRVSKYWESRFDALNRAYMKKFNAVTRRQELSSPLSEFMGVGIVVVLLWFGAQQVMREGLEAETFFAFVLAFYHVIEPLKSFSTAYYYLRRGSASLDRIEESIALSTDASSDKGKKDFVFEKEIVFDKLSYRYEAISVLNGLSFKIEKGQKVALVGPSGAGKSTIIRLLLKLIEADSGSIMIDGESISGISKESLNSHLGYVSQQSFLFNDTVRNNITLGREGFSDKKIYDCLRLACAEDFVRNLKMGLDTLIGDRGDKLSGGEKQRLTIARALLEDPEILILDEPTSALDPESEKAVSQAIINVLKERTAIIIAHRLSTIKFVNNIFVIDNGKIIESGDHQTLSSNQGMYSQYVNIQSIG